MTLEQYEKANKITRMLSDIGRIIDHIDKKHLLSLHFEWYDGTSTMASDILCEAQLKQKIFNFIKDRKQQLEKELEEL